METKQLDDSACKSEQYDIDISYMWQNHYAIRVSRSLSLKFRGDTYDYYMLQNSEKSKVYTGFPNDCVELLKDKYRRLWYHVYYSDIFEDRIEEIFDLVETEQEADERYANNGGGPRYQGKLPYFFASENFDFILHEDPTAETPGYIENKRNEIILLN